MRPEQYYFLLVIASSHLASSSIVHLASFHLAFFIASFLIVSFSIVSFPSRETGTASLEATKFMGKGEALLPRPGDLSSRFH